jgi:hypothetical protein
MHAGKLVFAQVIDHLPWKIFGASMRNAMQRGTPAYKNTGC